MSYVRIKANNYLCVGEDKMFEIAAKTQKEAAQMAKEYLDAKGQGDINFVVCRIPDCIGVLE